MQDIKEFETDSAVKVIAERERGRTVLCCVFICMYGYIEELELK